MTKIIHWLVLLKLITFLYLNQDHPKRILVGLGEVVIRCMIIVFILIIDILVNDLLLRPLLYSFHVIRSLLRLVRFRSRMYLIAFLLFMGCRLIGHFAWSAPLFDLLKLELGSRNRSDYERRHVIIAAFGIITNFKSFLGNHRINISDCHKQKCTF